MSPQGFISQRGNKHFPDAGDYNLSVQVTHGGSAETRGFLGTLVITASVRVFKLPKPPSDWNLSGGNGQRATVTVASGYTGLVHSDALRTYNSSVMIRTRGEFPPAFSAGVSEDGQGVLVSLTGSAPASGTLAFEVFNVDPRQAPNYVVGTLAQSVIVSVAAVEPPAQVGAEADYLRGFTVGLNLPQGYAAGENQPGRGLSLIVSEALSNVSLSLDAATDELAYAPNGVASDALPVGAYTVTAALTATDFLGTVLMEFAATVRALDLDSADYGLPQPEEVTVASGYTGYLHTDISLGASAADGVLSALSGAFPSGVSLSLLSDSRGVAAHLTQGLDGVSFRPEVTLTVSRGANYNPLEQIATLLVTALQTPPTASASGETFGFSASFEGNVVDLADAGYEEGAYSGGRFEETSSADLSVAADGQVSARKKLGVGDYLLTVTVRGRPDSRASADAFIGDATITVSLRVEQGSEAIAADDVVGASSRHVTLDAAAGYFGRGYAIPVSVNYTLSGEVYDSNKLGYDDVNKVITILSGNRVPSSGELTLTLSGDGGCGDGIRTCPTVPVSVTAVFRAVESPAQATLTASHLDADYDGRSHALVSPEGFAFSGATLSVAGAHGSRFTIVADKLQPVDAGNADRRPDVGKYVITVGMTHGGFLGTLALTVPVRMQESLLANSVLAERERVQDAVAGHFGRAGDAGHLLTVGSGYTLAALTSDAGSSATVLADGVYEVSLTMALGDSATVTASLEWDVECVKASRDCAPLRLSVTVYFVPLTPLPNFRAFEWQEPDGGGFRRYGLNIPLRYDAGGIAGYKLLGISRNGQDYKTVEETPPFTVSPQGFISQRGNKYFPDAGDYKLSVQVTHGGSAETRGFLGTLVITASVRVFKLPKPPSDWNLSGGNGQRATVTVASGYTGLVHSDALRTYNSSVMIRTRGEFPPAFSAGVSEDGQGVLVSLTGSAPASGTLAFEVFNVDPRQAPNYVVGTLAQSVIVSVAAVEPPAQVGAEADYLRGFTVGLNLPQGYAAGENQPGRGLSLIVSEALSNVSLSLDAATDELAYAPNGVASDALPVGAYTVTAALTATDFLGTVLMEFAATVRALDLDSADYGLPQPEEVTVASGYTGYLHTDISLGASAADGVLSALSGAFPSGVSLSLLSDSRGVAAHLTQGLDGVSFRPEVTLTVSRGANYNPLEQIATLLVTALQTPPTASASGETFGFSASFEGNVVDLADAGYEEGAYSGGRFEETSSADLSVAADGQVSARKKLGVGDYLLTVTVRGRPDSRASADAFIGDATITVSLRVEQGSEAIAADDVVGASSRHVTLDAAAGYFGRGYAIPVSANYTLSGEVYDSNKLGYDDVNKVITILSGNRVPSSGELTLTLSGDGGCGDGIRTCPTVPVSVTAVFRAVESPAQATLTASHLDADYAARSHALVSPEGFAFSGATLSVAGAHGSRFTIVADKLQPVDAGNADRRPDVGKYVITVGMTHGGFLGTLALTVPVRMQESLLANSVLADRERVQDAVAGHFGRAGDAGHLLTVGSGYTLAALTSDAGSSATVLADGVYEVSLTMALGDSATVTASLEWDVECVKASRDCAPLRLSVTVYFVPLTPLPNFRAFEWQEPDGGGFRRYGLNIPLRYDAGGIAGYKLLGISRNGQDYSDVKDAPFNVSPQGFISQRGNKHFPDAGDYNLSVQVTHGGSAETRGFLGTLVITASVRVFKLPKPPSDWNLSGGNGQRATVTVVSGYTGLVHSDALRTYNSSVMIRTRGEFPPAFSAGVSEDGQGVLVSLTGSAPASGTLAFEVFNIDPRQAPNYVVGTLAQSVIVSVAGVAASVAQNLATADYLRGFTVDLNFPSGYESVAGRSVTILYPLPREGALAASKEVCETLGGAHTADLDVCTGYSASSDHAPFVSEALKNPFAPATPPDDLSSRGACTWKSLLASAYYSCESAFAQARACNLANKAAKDNGSCAEAECGAGEFALGGKCLALRASGGRLEHAPTGAGNALPAGSHVIAARMTQSDLLGTVRLDVTATIARLSLNAADFSLSEPEPSSVVTVAAGALNVELARVWLTASALSVSEFGAHVSGVDKSAFPANLSLEILPVPENQTVVFYLSGTLAAGSEAERTATLDVAILDPNYAPVRQTVTLRIATLPYPARAEAVGHVGAGRPPYNSATLSAGHLHNFKTGRYATATNFVVDPSSSPELTVDADTGIVGTNGDITEAGIYVLIVSVASPDYVGRARLALGLTLEGVFTDAETIADGDRSRTVAVASGHSGSVAFFAAGRDGVALRTPSSVPSGFTLGAGGVDADFAAPAGFTLFLDAGVIAGGETATAAFAVTASVAFFAVSEISLTVIVSALRTPPTASASGETFGFSASYEGDVVNLAGAGYEESAYFGGRFEETSSSDLSVAADGQVSTREKLGVGDYLLTVTVRGRPDSRASADAFIGDATITVSLRVEQGSEAITADDVVGASSRHVTLDAAAGYFGRGYAIPVSANYTLSGEVYDSNKLGYDGSTR